MANNPYGQPPLPPMPNVNLSHQQYNHQYLQQQQQHQSERISGDGEEVHRLGYLRPAPTGPPPPPQFQPQLGVLPPPQAAPGIAYNYESFNQIPLSGNPYDNQYDYGAQVPMQPTGQQQQQNGVMDEAYPTVDNRSIDGEEQHLQRYGNDPMVPMQGMGMAPPGIPLMSLSSGSSGGGGILNPSPAMVNPPMTTMESHQPVGVEMPQQYQQILQQEQRSETIGSAAADSLPPPSMLAVSEEDYREIGGDFTSLGQQSDNDPRSIEGQEYPDPELLMDPIGASAASFISSSNPPLTSLSGIPSSQEHRSQTIGSETQIVDDDSRSIEGQEQVSNDFTITSGHVAGPPQSQSIQSAYQRSETLGSDTIHDEPPRGPSSKNKNTASKTLNPPSGSETGDSVGRSTKDVDDRRRRKQDFENTSARGKRSEETRHRRRYPSFEEDDDSYEEGDRDRFEGRREREWDTSRKVRTRDKDRHRPANESRHDPDDWDSVSTRDSFRHSKNYGGDVKDYRPRSRNSSYHDREDYDRDRRSRYPPRRPRDYDIDYNRSHDYRHGGPRGHAAGYVDPYVAPPRNFGGMPYPDQYAPAAPVSDPRMYLEKLRRENPVLYRDWYDKYQVHLKNPKLPVPPIPGFHPPVIKNTQMPKRDTTHSGRSSRAGEISTQFDGNSSTFRPIQDEPCEPSLPERTTPTKFHTSHSLGILTPLGHLLRLRNGGTVVELLNIKPLMKKLPEYKEVKAFPGPLIKDVTHKNTIVQFCQRKIRELEFNDGQVDRDNLILLWELLILLLKQNGMAIGSDIAELLLKSKSVGQEIDRNSDRESSEDEANRNIEPVDPIDKKNEEKCIEKFCELLLYGHKKEALDYAMDNGLWGHALFFASKMGERTYGNVLARFANGMAMNSPLQTLYQVLSGKQPASVTCACDDSFGDWKPHLAMILSNAGQRPEVEAKAITTLGDTLGNRNHPFAAQFCYLMAEVEFSTESKLGTLLGFTPSMNNLIEATQMTEIYEFARTLGNPNYSLGTPFIQRKLNYTKTLIDLGFTQDAFLYCEELTKSLRKSRIHESEQSAGWSILQIAERLVNCDDSNSLEPAWIDDLRKITDQVVGSESGSRKLSLATTSSDQNEVPPSINQYSSDMHQPSALPQSQNGVNFNSGNQFYPETPYVENSTSSTSVQGNIQQNQNQWNQPQTSLPYENTPMYDVSNNVPTTTTHQYPPDATPMSNGPSNPTYDTTSSSVPNNTHSNNNYLYSTYGSNQDQSYGNSATTTAGFKDTVQQPVSYPKREDVAPKPSGENKPRKDKSADKSNSLGGQKQTNSWFGGIFGKLIPKPGNQVHLPDDKEPAIIWDPVKKVWVNANGEEDEDSGPKGPPPTDFDLGKRGSFGPPSNVPPMQNVPVPMGNPMSQAPVPQITNPMTNGLPANHVPNSMPTNPVGMNGNGVISNSIPPPGANAVNKYQRPKGISMRNNYVDVFNPNAPRKPAEESKMPLPTTTGPGMPNIFIPNPAPVASDSGPTSFLSSAPESFSNEGSEQAPPTPQMFDPSQFQNNNQRNDYGLIR